MAAGVDQHVRGLDVAVDHQVAVGVGDRAADLQVQAHDGVRIERMLVAPAVDALAVDQRHGQPAGAVVGHARVDQGGDVGVVEAGQDLGLAVEALAPGGAQRAQGQDLDRGLLAGHALLAPGAVDHGHAAAAELAVQGPGAEMVAGQVVAGLQAGAWLAVCADEPVQAPAHRIGRRLRGKPGVTFVLGQVQPLVEQRIRRLPVGKFLRIHRRRLQAWLAGTPARAPTRGAPCARRRRAGSRSRAAPGRRTSAVPPPAAAAG